MSSKLKLGYKASAEQFGPRPLLAAHQWARALRLVLAGCSWRANPTCPSGHKRSHPHFPLPACCSRPGLWNISCPEPWPDDPGRWLG